jgi:hypothetical protein
MPVKTIAPGWYGYDFDARDNPAWRAFTIANRGKVLTRTTWSTKRWSVVLIEVKAPVSWTLSGTPRPAPKAMGTTLQDLTREPDLSPGFAVMIEELTGQFYETFRATGQTLKAVGGAAASAASSGATLVYVVAAAAVVWALSGRS